VQARRLAESFEPLNISLPLLVPELRLRKAMCDLFFFLVRNHQSLLDAKVLKPPNYRTQKHTTCVSGSNSAIWEKRSNKTRAKWADRT